MKKHFPMVILTLALALTACQAITITPTNQPSTQPVSTATIPAHSVDTKPASTTVAPPSATSSPTVTLTLTPANTPTPAIQLDLRRYDFDVWPPIQILHNPPVIVRADETADLGFDVHSRYCRQLPNLTCTRTVTLFVSYGEGNDFAPIPLIAYSHEGFDYFISLPASDESGQPLRRYYLQVTDPQVGLDIRYPTAGAVDLFVADELIAVDLPAQKPLETGELALGLPWGDDPEAVGLRQQSAGSPWRQGPVAMDVADDGRIALLDLVKERILIFDPTKGFTTIPIPFKLLNYPDVQFDRDGQIAVFDPTGEPLEGQSAVYIPRFFRFLSDGQIGAVAPVFVRWPGRLNEDLQVFDTGESRLVTPFDASGKANSRETQRQKQSPRLTMKYMLETVNDVRFADWEKGIAFAVHSESNLGAIICFEKTPQGYAAVFEGDQLRAIWFDESGKVLKDVTLPREEYSEIKPVGRTSVMPDGSLNFLRSTEKGIEVRSVTAP